MSLLAVFQRQSKGLVLAEALIVCAGIGYLDYLTPWQWTLLILYALPIFMVVLKGHRQAPIFMAFATTGTWFWANYHSHPFLDPNAYLWIGVNRLVYFIFVAIGARALKDQREEMRARVEAMEHARELEQEIVRVSEREQMRIGQDLHDGICQRLAAIDCAAACLKAELQGKHPSEAASAATIQRMLKEAIVETRSLARGIFPVQMDAEGLPAALEEMVSNTNRLRELSATFDTTGDVAVPEPAIAMHLYRIAQEALNNVVRHAGARHVAISLHREAERLTLTVADDGCGLLDSGKKSNGLGLRTMSYRARQIGAELEFVPLSAGGTMVRCALPTAALTPQLSAAHDLRT